jgi:hypothetical protein
MRDEGYTKYRCHHRQGSLPTVDTAPLCALRNGLHRAGLIGQYPDGIGYGNVSQRLTEGLLITATQTGHLSTLTAAHLCHVYRCDAPANTLWCQGPAPASSEAMTHHSIYAAHPAVQVVAHVHHGPFWAQHLFALPTTPALVPYGTPAMAAAVDTLVRHLGPQGIFLTVGHAQGIFVYAQDYPTLLALLEAHFPEFTR